MSDRLTTLSRIQGLIRDLILESWLYPYELVREIKARTGVLISESSCTARIRELRGFGYQVDRRQLPKRKAFQYCIPTKAFELKDSPLAAHNPAFETREGTYSR